jgi:hypothetical protein
MVDGYFIRPRDAGQIEMLPGVHRRTMATTDEVMLRVLLDARRGRA